MNEEVVSLLGPFEDVFRGSFPDSAGGNKCGRLTRDEENALDKDDPSYINSRADENQVIYGRIAGTFKNADGDTFELDEPMIAYFAFRLADL